MDDWSATESFQKELADLAKRAREQGCSLEYLEVTESGETVEAVGLEVDSPGKTGTLLRFFPDPDLIDGDKDLECRECGQPCFVTPDSISHHSDEDEPDGINHDMDADHVAIPEDGQ